MKKQTVSIQHCTKSERGFVIVNRRGDMHTATVRRSARESKAAITNKKSMDVSGISKAWKDWYKHGWRCVRVTITPETK